MRSDENSCKGLIGETYHPDLKTINGINFTDREIDVISFILSNKAAKNIASLLSISDKTVATHLQNIMGKINCSSREGIINFIEKHGVVILLKKHYVNLLVKVNFEKELKQIAEFAKPNINCAIFYYKSQRANDPFIYQLEKHLQLAKIKTVSKIWEKGKSLPYLANHTKNHQLDCVIYAISKEFLAQLQATDHDLNIEVSKIKDLLKDKPTPIIFLLLEKLANDNVKSTIEASVYLDCKNQENYYLLIFKLLELLITSENTKQDIEHFKKQYEAFLAASTQPIWPSEQQPFSLTKNNSNTDNFFDKKRPTSKAIILLAILMFGFLSFGYVKYLYQGFLNPKQIVGQNSEQHLLKSFKTWPLQLPSYASEHFIERKINNISFMEVLHTNLKTKGTSIPTLVIYGLGGIGKTQISYHYIHSKLAQKNYNVRVWFSAENKNSLDQSYLEFAKALGLIQAKDYNGSFEYIRNLVLNWFAEHPGWLIVFDNVVDYESISPYLPKTGGSILITSRQAIWPNTIKTLNIKAMQEDEAVLLVRAFSGYKSEADATLAKKLDCFPLAMAQAASYMQVHKKSATEYIALYENCQQELLSKDLRQYGVDHEPTLITWKNSLNAMQNASTDKKNNMLAKDFLMISAYLAPEKIPKIIIEQWVKKTIPNTKVELKADAIVEKLLAHSFINRAPNGKTFNIHRLLQATIRNQNKCAGVEEIYITNVLDLLVQLFTKDLRSVKSFQINYNLLPHIDAILAYANEHLENKHIKLQVARLLNVKAYFYTQTGVAVLQNAAQFSMLAKQYYEELASITPRDANLWQQDTEELEIKTKKCAEKIYQKLKLADLSPSEQKLLPILYASSLYITGRMHFFMHDEKQAEYFKAELYMSKHISELIENNTGQKIFYKILALRDGLLVFNNFNNASAKELEHLKGNYLKLLADMEVYTNEDGQKQYLKNDNYHKLVCYRRLLQILNQHLKINHHENYYKEVTKYINKIEKLLRKNTDLERAPNYYNTIGDFYLLAKQDKSAIIYYTKAKDIEEAKSNGRGKMDYPLADAYYGLAKSYFNVKNYKAAKEAVDKCLKIRETLYKPDNPLLLATKNMQTEISNK